MSDPKPFASLSSGLLARKGAARPAMRPQGFSPNSNLDDLGWNDMGHDQHRASPLSPLDPPSDEQVVEHPRAHHHSLGLTPVSSPVHSQQAELADRLADADHEDDEAFDEEYDETAELYEPEAGSGSFKGFDFSDEDEEEPAEPEFRVQFKGGKKPLDLGPGPVEFAAPESPFAAEIEPAAFADEEDEDVLDLVDEVADEPAMDVAAPAFDPVAEAPVEPVRAEPEVVAFVPEPQAEPEPEPEPVRAAPVARAPRAPRANPGFGGKSKAAFTLRLDPQRHLKLRLACAVRGSSAQQLVTDALDRLLASMPEVEELADKARERG